MNVKEKLDRASELLKKFNSRYGSILKDLHDVKKKERDGKQ